MEHTLSYGAAFNAIALIVLMIIGTRLTFRAIFLSPADKIKARNKEISEKIALLRVDQALLRAKTGRKL